MSDAVRRVSVRLSLEDGAQVKAGLRDVGENGQRELQRIVTGAQGASRALALLGPVLAGLSIGGMAAFVRRSIDAVGGLGELSDQLGVTTDALQAYRYAATQVGLSSEQLDLGLRTLTRRIGEAAAGSKEAQAAFAQFGVRFAEANGRIRSTESVLADVADRIAAIESPAERAALVSELFGSRVGQKLIPFLAGGRDALESLTDEALRYGAIADAELIEKADRASDKIASLSEAFSRLATNLVASVAPAVSTVADALAGVLRSLNAPGTEAQIGPLSERALQNVLYRMAEIERQRERVLAQWRERGIDPAVGAARDPRFAVWERELESLRAQEQRIQAALDAAAREETERQRRVDQILAGRPSAPTAQQPAADRSRQDKEKAERERAQRELDRLIQQNEDAYERYQRRLENLSRLVVQSERFGMEVPAATIAREAQAALDDLIKTEERLNDTTRITKSIANDLGLSFSSAFEDAIVKGRKFSEVLNGLAADIARIIVRRSITEPFSQIVTGLVSSLDLGALFNAKGNVFNAGHVQPFARGGIVSQPTVFPMANGIGLMGEAGPEAIMPLRRLPSGRLGVEARGAAPSIGVSVNIDARGADPGTDARLRAIVPTIIEAAKRGVLDAIRRGGEARAVVRG